MPASFSVRAPASSANLGPGFDSLALALDLWLHASVTRTATGEIRDVGSVDLLGGVNLVIEAMTMTARRLGVTLPGCDITVSSDIPVARGLGSSAAAIVAGIRAAGELAGVELPLAQIVDIGGEMEGHADNVSAAVLGGVTVAAHTAVGYVADVLVASLPWRAVVFIPHSHSLTKDARDVLPALVPLRDAAANIGRGVLLAHALRSHRSDLVREGMVDFLHQPYRAEIFQHLEPAIAAALHAGAIGACLSGAGPSVLALASAACAEGVGVAMTDASGLAGVDG
ncbi:MAG TPA: homoserine kinase, partial [Thermomicrobiales bacterium]|nr:homoserine kinase [Thermomicrobiales bacterium]